MTHYRRRFGEKDCEIDIRMENGTCVARLYEAGREGTVPILNDDGLAVVFTATSEAWVYLFAVRFLAEHFGPASD